MSEETATVLVVDDNEWNRDVLSRRLRRSGFNVLVAQDGHQALDIARKHTIDLILLDIMMPGITGLEVLRTLRQTHPPTELPIIMATAKDQSEDMVEALELGANDYVTKPLDFPVVLARVQAQLRSRVSSSQAMAVVTDGDRQTLGVGRVLAGKYRLETPIGTGNFGAVYRATQLVLERPVAVKVLQTKFDSKSSLARFQREGVSACRIQHANAVSVIDFDVTPDGIAYLVMELLRGHSLAEELSRSPVRSPERCAQVLLPCCDVLAEAHSKGIIHRDVKPANIFLHRNRQAEVVKVLDFGIAKLVDEESGRQNLTLDGGVLGTPAYMAPERFDPTDHDGRADVYSLGILLFQMLTGELPFPSRSNDPLAQAMMQLREKPRPLRQVAPDMPAALEKVIFQALEKDYRQRPDVVSFGRSLAAALGVPAPGLLQGEPDEESPSDLELMAEEAGSPEEEDTLRLGKVSAVWKPPDDL